MSQIHYLKIAKPVDFAVLEKEIKSRLGHVEAEQRESNLFYFWIPEKSARGVDFTFERADWIEIRNTVCSNAADYLLTNHLAEAFCELFDGQLYKDNEDFDEDCDDPEDEFLPESLPVFEQKKAEEQMKTDANLFRILIQNRQSPITIYGPVRTVHFGKDLMEYWRDLNHEELGQEMENVILNVNYGLPDFEYGNIMQMGDGEDQKILKLLTNNTCLIDKYDYLMLKRTENSENIEDFIVITNDDLNQILPESWKRVDEYHIVAPELPEDEFRNLIQNAELYNRFDEVFKKK
ncbi:hypothetical protein AAH994_14240 [Weeksellaceae bacterium A-14]